MEIYCNLNSCGKRQEYRGQVNCDHCKKRLNHWSIASQINAFATASNQSTEVLLSQVSAGHGSQDRG